MKITTSPFVYRGVAVSMPEKLGNLQGVAAKSDNGGGVVKKTSQRSLLFRQNVNRTESEWVADSAAKHAKLSETIISRLVFSQTTISR